MSAIIKTEAVVLSKLNYGDSSSIVNLYTKDYGKLSAILKGGRNPKSKLSLVVDPINYLEVIIYNKPSRDLQILSSADIKSHYHKIKEDLDKLKYAHAVIELVKNLSVEHESNKKLFTGIIRILKLIDEGNEHPGIQFGRFFLFFLKEMGYEFQIKKCASCGKINLSELELSYNYEIGILCDSCRNRYLTNINISPELFHYLKCLNNNENSGTVNPAIINGTINFLEGYLKYHVSDFKGLQSLHMFKEKY
jgi:DNA repair protein RecO (recombination protein O)